MRELAWQMGSSLAGTDVLRLAAKVLGRRTALTESQAAAVLVDMAEETGVDIGDLAALIVESGQG